MKSRVFSFLLALLGSYSLISQVNLEGKIFDAETGKPISSAEVYLEELRLLRTTDYSGKFVFSDLEAGTYHLTIVSLTYNTTYREVIADRDVSIDVFLEPFQKELSEVVISQKREELFAMSRLRPVEGTAIYAGKKTEVVLLDQTVGNLASNNARQIYSQVVGLNIYESIDAGLQLNVGGRGLDPNRTANFNTRQNGYDISADVLGYPESYYTPPAEALREIQIVRGAASLQYGTQFGGLINFKMKGPAQRPVEFVARQSIGSFGLLNSFTSLGGTKGKWSYYTYYQHKRGDGFRPNSEFDSNNLYLHVGYTFNEKTKLTFEGTYLDYLAKQGGGLTDEMFAINPDSSVRARNWFQVDWKLFALKLEHKFSSRTELSIQTFGLDAERNAIGFRGDPRRLNQNPVNTPDNIDDITRDLIIGQFNNWGSEARLLHRYKVGEKNAVALFGAKYYKANNTSIQGPGTNGSDANFSLQQEVFPSYPNQSTFSFPNENLALFGEYIFFLSDRLSITPGLRLEFIKTQSEGTYRVVNFDLSGQPISQLDTTDNRILNRSFALFGIGASYELTENLEGYANISENYRSVTFSDIRVANPSFIIDADIQDEEGYTADFGVRGKVNQSVSFELGGFGLLYDRRIGEVFNDRAQRVRKNIGKAFIYGIEAFIDWNILSSLQVKADQGKWKWFINAALTDSEYIESEENNVQGKEVEFIPGVNLKSGFTFGYKNMLGSFQFTHVGEQYTDAQNSAIPPSGDQRQGLLGEIPAYQVMDLSFSYTHKKWRLETGINNLTNNRYFTRRASGYPGPGIIPSEPRTYYVALQFKH